jgi:hypothetical protein
MAGWRSIDDGGASSCSLRKREKDFQGGKMTRLLELREELEVVETERELAEAEAKLAEIQEKRRSNDNSNGATSTVGNG